MRHWHLLLPLSLASCTATPSAPRAWELTSIAFMPFSVANTQYTGVATLQRQTSHLITFKPRYAPREFMVFTCGRETFVQSPTQEIKFDYRPTWGVEFEGACPLFAVSISQKGERETAVVDFNNGYTAASRVRCNGAVTDVVGASLCQIRAGMYVGVRFTKPFIVEADTGCPAPEKKPLYEWEIKAASGHCSYLFADSPTNIFRLTVRGYDSILEEQK
jgi:hypothetical protein